MRKNEGEIEVCVFSVLRLKNTHGRLARLGGHAAAEKPASQVLFDVESDSNFSTSSPTDPRRAIVCLSRD